MRADCIIELRDVSDGRVSGVQDAAFGDHRPSHSSKSRKARVVKKAICIARAPTHVSVRAHLVSRLLDAARGSHAPPGETVSCVASRISHTWRVRCHSLSLSLFPSLGSPQPPIALACAVFFLLRRSNISGPRGRPTWAWQLSPRETGYTHNYVSDFTPRREEAHAR